MAELRQSNRARPALLAAGKEDLGTAARIGRARGHLELESVPEDTPVVHASVMMKTTYQSEGVAEVFFTVLSVVTPVVSCLPLPAYFLFPRFIFLFALSG